MQFVFTFKEIQNQKLLNSIFCGTILFLEYYSKSLFHRRKKRMFLYKKKPEQEIFEEYYQSCLDYLSRSEEKGINKVSLSIRNSGYA